MLQTWQKNVTPDGKLTGLKSHDCHVIMQRLLALGIRPFLPKPVRETFVELCNFFKLVSDRTLQVSAIEKAWKVFYAIMELESKRNAGIKDPLYKGIPIPFPINIGKILGGSWPSSVADLVTLEGRIGVGPEEEMQDVKTQLRDCIGSVTASDDWLKEHPAKLEFFGGQWIPNTIEANHPFVNLIKENFEEIYKKPIKIEASPWGTDGGILAKVGNTPTIVIGPGETKMAHYPNEFIDLEEVIQAGKLFANMILEWCEVAETNS